MVSLEGWLWVFRAGVGFLLLATLLFLLGYATDHWHDDDSIHYGLWNSCNGAECSELESDELPAYHIATQAFQTTAVIFFGLSPIVHLFVYSCKKKKDTGWRSRIFDIGYSSGILFHICSLLIFGLENPTPENFSWSYRMSCASSAIAFLGIAMIILSRSKALNKFTFRSVSRSKRKTANDSSIASDKRFDHTTSSSRANPFHNHPQDAVIISSASEQSHSMRVPETNVKINININAGPSPNITESLSPSHQPVSSITAEAHGQPFLGSPARLPPIVPENNQPLHPKPSDTLVGYPLTRVLPAPKSSIAPYTSPTHKKTFGPADQRNTLKLVDNSEFLHATPNGKKSTLPSISGRCMPSAPPCDGNGIDRDNPPPSYSDALGQS